MSKIDRKLRPAVEEAGSSLREGNQAYVRELRRTALSAAIAFVALLIGGTLYLNRGPAASQSAGPQRATSTEKAPAIETADEEFDRLQREKFARLGIKPETATVAEAATAAAPGMERSKPELEIDLPAVQRPSRPGGDDTQVATTRAADRSSEAVTREIAAGREHPLPAVVETSVPSPIHQVEPVQSAPVDAPPRATPKPLVAEAPLAVDTLPPSPPEKAPHRTPAIVTAPVATPPVPAPAVVAKADTEQRPAAPVPAPLPSKPTAVGPGARPTPAPVVEALPPAPAAKAAQVAPVPVPVAVPVQVPPPAIVTPPRAASVAVTPVPAPAVVVRVDTEQRQAAPVAALETSKPAPVVEAPPAPAAKAAQVAPVPVPVPVAVPVQVPPPAIVTPPRAASVAVTPVPAPALAVRLDTEQRQAAPVPAIETSKPAPAGPRTKPAPALTIDMPEPAPTPVKLVPPAPVARALPVAAKASPPAPPPAKLIAPVVPSMPVAVSASAGAGAGVPRPAPSVPGPLASLERPALSVEPVARAPLAITQQPPVKAAPVPTSLAKDQPTEPSGASTSEAAEEGESMWRSLVASVSGMLRPSRQLDTLDTATIQDCPECPVLALVRPGYFTTTVDGRRSVRTRISRPFALAQSPVTVAQYARFIAATGRAKPRCNALDGDPAQPVTCVAVEDARDYVKWLGGQSGQVYRLPSAAEWEYASGRAGEPNPDEPDPTLFAVRHMGGKVAEIVADCWLGEDTVSPSDGSAIIVDGGCRPRVLISYGEGETSLAGKTALRRKIDYGQALPHIGFRIARELVLTRRY